MRATQFLAAIAAIPLAFAATITVPARAVGRLFALNGKVTYFAGPSTPNVYFIPIHSTCT